MCPLPPLSLGGSLPTWDGHLASSKDHRKGGARGSATRGLAGGCIHTTTHCAPTAQAAGGTFEGLHAAVPLDMQMLQSPALPALPKLHLDLPWEKKRNKSHHAN
jgi:hypothetical protein